MDAAAQEYLKKKGLRARVAESGGSQESDEESEEGSDEEDESDEESDEEEDIPSSAVKSVKKDMDLMADLFGPPEESNFNRKPDMMDEFSPIKTNAQKDLLEFQAPKKIIFHIT